MNDLWFISCVHSFFVKQDIANTLDPLIRQIKTISINIFGIGIHLF